MKIHKDNKILNSEITPESIFHTRRSFIGKSIALASGSLAMLPGLGSAGLQEDDAITPEKIVTSYNNFYEFGTDKSDPVNYAHNMVVDPWTVEVMTRGRDDVPAENSCNEDSPFSRMIPCRSAIPAWDPEFR